MKTNINWLITMAEDFTMFKASIDTVKTNNVTYLHNSIDSV